MDVKGLQAMVNVVNDDLMTRKELAEYLKVSPNTINRWKIEGKYPDLPEIKIGRILRYRLSEIDAWMEKHKIATG